MAAVVEKFDFLEFLRLAIANSEGNPRSKITKSIVLGELALLPLRAGMWAGLLVQRVDFERIATITPPEIEHESSGRCMPDQVQWRRSIEVKPGKVTIKAGEIQGGDYYRVRNFIASQLHIVMIKSNFKPYNSKGDLAPVAKGIADVVMRGHIFVKGMCAPCSGVGLFEVFEGNHSDVKTCLRCSGTGKIPYTIDEKIKLAKLKIDKANYYRRYSAYERLGESLIAEWENQIRDQLARSFYTERNVVGA